MDDAGVKITFIYAGDHKVDGNPYEPLPEDVKNRMQARIDGLYDIFVSTVARNLGIAEEAVRATEALTYSAEEAVSIGFAHEILACDEAKNRQDLAFHLSMKSDLSVEAAQAILAAAPVKAEQSENPGSAF